MKESIVIVSIVTICLSFSAVSFAQNKLDKPLVENGKLWGIMPIADSAVVYSEIVKCENLPKKEIFRRARMWMARDYRAVNNAINIDDPENAELAFMKYYPFLGPIFGYR